MNRKMAEDHQVLRKEKARLRERQEKVIRRAKEEAEELVRKTRVEAAELIKELKEQFNENERQDYGSL